jgi:RNA polymerase sigma factor (TIGR02999 family)
MPPDSPLPTPAAPDPRGTDDATFFSQVYVALRRIAEAQMAQQKPSHTLQATALVNEVYLKLAGARGECTSLDHFYNLAARAMRQILVDHARKRRAQSRPPESARVPLDAIVDSYEASSGDLLELEDLLQRIETHDREFVRMVELRFFGGRTTEEIAQFLGRSTRDVERRWQVLRKLLARELGRV